MAQSPPAGWQIYRDPQGRFQFQYPQSFGEPSPGTDNGFGNRIAAIRFPEFSAHADRRGIILGGEAVLAAGPPQRDLQTAGGLYDAITLQVFPAQMADVVKNALAVLTPANFCDAIAREQHLDPADRRLSVLTATQREGIGKVDRMGNTAPRVVSCEVSGDAVTFHKESKFDAAGSSRQIYGAIRFLTRPYSSFQLVRGSAEAPDAAMLQQIQRVVNSWRENSSRVHHPLD